MDIALVPRWSVSFELGLDSETLTNDTLRSFFRQVMDHLHDAGAVDPDMGGDLSGVVTVSTVQETEDLGDAVRKGLLLIRSAIQDSGGSTSDWPSVTGDEGVENPGALFPVVFFSSSITRV